MIKLKQLLKKKFIRNVVIIATGTAGAQAINLLFAPIITRIYGPEAYGVLGVFMAVVNIIAPIAALTYPIAIVLPKEEKDAITIGKVSIYIAVFLSLITMCILFFFKETIVAILQIDDIAPFLFLIPVVILFSAFLQIIEQWLIRNKLFKIKAKVTFLQSLVMNIAKVGGGILTPVASVLVILAAIGNGLKGIMLLSSAVKVDNSIKEKFLSNKSDITSLKEMTIRYRDFPYFRAPQVLVDGITQNLPILMLTAFFGPAAAGFYSIGRTVLGVPSQLIGKAVGDVFYPRISDAANSGENLPKLIKKATLGLSIIGIIPFGIVIIFGPWLFSIVFGSEWDVAGEYARWIAIWAYFKFLNQPSIRALPVLSAQSFHLKFTMIILTIQSLSLALGYYWFKSDLVAIAFFACTGAILNIILIYWTIKISEKYV
ncbi:lipopolysaccharide biosynthesis protein [Alkalihalobacterium elongatum]|uniref:lipopolysaccharide biosynthesis protein n=1 Tax=Alkalihalobacterium elongatum TaxID=2675466 RepID=UPI001C1F21E5|nr:oligosaccharide flippase family protein [Alkalihalobacterium elongatum]